MGLIKLNGVNYWGSNYGAGIVAPMIYSDEEREVGVWRDGKPLYQKTVKVTSSSAHSTIIAHGIANIENVVHVFGILDRADSVFLPTNYSRWDGTSEDLVGCHATTTDIALYVNTSAYYGKTVYVTLQYTKTTDTAGSGNLTPSGAVAVHYSTNEQVIGTWVDGKPLYQKTYSGLSAVSDTTFHTIGVTISNVETLVNAQTTGRQANGRLSTQNPMTNIQTDGTVQTCENVNGWAINTLTLQYTKTTD